MNLKETVYGCIEDRKQEYIKASDQIWGFAETIFEEHQSARLLADLLEGEGFAVERGLGGMPTCFSATYGRGKPVIGILAEYDALDGMSQVADLPEQKPLEPGKPGHGCGHNTFGAGCALAAVAVKKAMEEHGLSGTVKLFGCPAEEGGSGKVFMIREGLFEDVDAAMAWHAWFMNGYLQTGSLANYKVRFKFKGVGSHASASPHLGRSALDAMELMNVGLNFLREHIIPEARIHYAFLNAGGSAANVVQSDTEGLYVIRAPKMTQVREIFERVRKIAQGAALMTETEMQYRITGTYSDYKANHTICRTFYRHLQEVIPIGYTDEEKAYAQKFKDTLTPDDVNTILERTRELAPGADLEEVAKMSIQDMLAPSVRMYGSSDVGDVSWVVPTAHFGVVVDAMGTPGHSWQRVAQGKSSIAHKGMVAAAKVMAMSVVDFLADPSLVEQAKADFAKQMKGLVYEMPLPADLAPGADV